MSRPPNVCTHQRLDWTLNVLAKSRIVLVFGFVFVTVHRNPVDLTDLRHWDEKKGINKANANKHLCADATGLGGCLDLILSSKCSQKWMQSCPLDGDSSHVRLV